MRCSSASPTTPTRLVHLCLRAVGHVAPCTAGAPRLLAARSACALEVRASGLSLWLERPLFERAPLPLGASRELGFGLARAPA